MASSSRTYHQTLKTCNNTKEHNFVEEEKLKEEEEEEWLKLGLGLGSGRSCKKIVDHESNLEFSSSSQTMISSSQIGLGLGFEGGLSFEQPKGKDGSRGLVDMMEHGCDHGNSLLGWPSSDHCNNDHYYHHNDKNGMVLWPSSCQIGPQAVPYDSHHYSARNPHQSGLWFTLLSSTNWNGEALPQLPKAYIRVKDESMTVFMVKKYLVRKLGLSNEAEIDISCMGQSLSHIQSLKQVRDTIWLPRLVESVNSSMTLSLGDSHDMSINHLMSLLYRKHCIFN